MTSLKIVAAMSPFTLAATTEVSMAEASGMSTGLIQTIVQGGALALCAVLVLWLCYSFSKVLADHKKERQELVKALQDQIKRDQLHGQVMVQALNRVANALHERPCLVKCADFNTDFQNNITNLPKKENGD